MKSIYLAALAAMFFAPFGDAQAACIKGAANGNSLEIYSKPMENGPVIGGVRVGECNIEVVGPCNENGFCEVYMGSLSGWAEGQYILVDPDEVPPRNFAYQVTGGDGTLTMGGRKQPAPIEKRGKLIFTPVRDGMQLTLPREFGEAPVRLRRTGSSSFSGVMNNWGGFPIKVDVIAERVSAVRASVEFFARNSMLQMDLKLDLKRINQAQFSTRLSPEASPRAAAPVPASGPSASRTAALPNPTAPASGDRSLCGPLASVVGPVLQMSNGSTKRKNLMRVLRQVGVFDIAGATELQCFEIAAELVGAGVLNEGDIDLSRSPYDGLGGPDPAYMGEDPATMIEGGIEGPGHGEPASPSGPVAQACIELADHIIQIVTDNRSGAVRILQTKLIATNLDGIRGKTEQHCLYTSSELRRAGLTR